MKMSLFRLIGALALAANCAIAFALPTQKDVEAAIRAENWGQVESMMTQVTQAKPNNAKAWYFLSQSEEKLQKFSAAESALHRAETLDPTLSFASPGSVQIMEQRLQTEMHPLALNHTTSVPYLPNPIHANDSGHSFLWMAFFVLIFSLVVYAIWRAFFYRPVVVAGGGVYGGGVYGGGIAGGGYPVGYGGGGYPVGGGTVVVNNGNNGTGLLGTMILADALSESHHHHDRYYDSAPVQSSGGWDSTPAPAAAPPSSFDLGGNAGGWDSGSSSSGGGFDSGSSGGGDW